MEWIETNKKLPNHHQSVEIEYKSYDEIKTQKAIYNAHKKRFVFSESHIFVFFTSVLKWRPSTINQNLKNNLKYFWE